MARSPKDPFLSGVDDKRVDALARRVISALRNRPPRELRDRIRDATDWLVETVLSKDIFIAEDARAELMSRNLLPADIMDHCIADAARELGERWTKDVATFSQVSLGSARLHGLCKHFAVDWEPSRNLRPNGSVLIAVCDREDHLIGPVILADQLRRAGYSVHLMVRATPEKLLSKLTSEPFSTVLISCSGLGSLTDAASAVKLVRRKLSKVPRLVLGGPVLDHAEDLLETTGVDLVTNSIAAAVAVPDDFPQSAAVADK
ncbi:cobalamin B12-binding domain-containing protein [Sedimentitalea arenosa]|jgi:methanogenic corrinoid protein MtbC1|uniref:Cobalamin B12-binding domain-containing protein n=1 Tax=Sedimentitalea arenosa TaxID=2798803 RepID=A0A8J7LQ16_9RHOB|nr:cobalamin B12-binding domain-containing protein [Arenibacterium arenosum]MBJ6370093.1 cobalamin B12-binding domain-containing protein [Arenibacterium arenosum]